MSLVVGSVKHQLRRVIAKFKFDELEQAVLPSFPEITWDKLRTFLMKRHQNLTVRASVSVILQVIEDAEISDVELRDRLTDLELLEISRHSFDRVWTCYQLAGTGPDDDFQSDLEIRNKISESFRRCIYKMDVRATSHNGITFVQYVAEDFLKAMTIGLGYTRSKLHELSGKDLKSLITILQAKDGGAITSVDITKRAAYPGLKPVIGRTGIDFTESKQKGEFVDVCFGNEPPVLQSLKVNYENQTWKCSELVPDITNEPSDVKWEFRSHNIVRMMKGMVQRRVMRLPMPQYAQDILAKGQNTLTID